MYVLLSSAYLKKGNITKAVDNLRQALKLDPFNDVIRVQLARVFEREQLYSEAVKLLENIEPEEIADACSRERLSILVDCYIGECRYNLATQLLEEYSTS